MSYVRIEESVEVIKPLQKLVPSIPEYKEIKEQQLLNPVDTLIQARDPADLTHPQETEKLVIKKEKESRPLAEFQPLDWIPTGFGPTFCASRPVVDRQIHSPSAIEFNFLESEPVMKKDNVHITEEIINKLFGEDVEDIDPLQIKELKQNMGLPTTRSSYQHHAQIFAIGATHEEGEHIKSPHILCVIEGH